MTSSEIEKYDCKLCEYETNKLHNWMRHISSKRHFCMVKEKNAQVAHECKRCKYKTTKINHWKKHLNTSKHKSIVSNDTAVHFHYCNICNKKYKYKNGLVKHMKKCKVEQVKKEETPKSLGITSNENKLFEKIDSLIEQNLDLQNKLVEIAKQPKIEKQTNNFNIIQYLNTDCKNAMNLSDFINTLQVTFKDLDLIEKQGYLRGVQDSLVMSLEQMEQTQRPIHCTDAKRKQFYIKDNDNWDKDMNQKKLENTIRELNTLQLKTLYSWQQMNPEWLNEEGKRDKVNQITQELTSMYCSKSADMKKKILNEITNATLLNKNNYTE